MTELRLAALTADDTELLATFRCATDPRAGYAFEVQRIVRTEIARQLAAEHADLAAGAWIGDQLAGVMCYTRPGPIMWCTVLAVEVRHQRSGVALFLKTNLISAARSTGKAKYLVSRVDPENGPMIALNRKLGAKVVPHPRDYNDRESRDWMICTVTL